MPFKDRTEAGRRLAGSPELESLEQPLLVALSRGGALVALEPARARRTPLRLDPVVEIATPGSPEYVVGAVAAETVHTLDVDALEALGVTEDALALRAAEATAARSSLAVIHRSTVAGPAGRDVVVVDDGAASTLALEALARDLRASRARSLTLLSPGPVPDPPDGYDRIGGAVFDDDEAALVGLWYEDPALPDEQAVAELLRLHNSGHPA